LYLNPIQNYDLDNSLLYLGKEVMRFFIPHL
jgi:hypothetical protein